MPTDKKREAMGQFVAARLYETGEHPGFKITGTRLMNSVDFTIVLGSGKETIIGYHQLFVWCFADRQDRAGCSGLRAFKTLLNNLGLASPWDLLDGSPKESCTSKPPEAAIKREVIDVRSDSEDESKPSWGGSKFQAPIPAAAPPSFEKLNFDHPDVTGRSGKPSSTSVPQDHREDEIAFYKLYSEIQRKSTQAQQCTPEDRFFGHLKTYLEQQFNDVVSGVPFDPRVIRGLITEFENAMESLRSAQRNGGGMAVPINKRYVQRILEKLEDTLKLVKSES